jgi:hypothetical protein
MAQNRRSNDLIMLMSMEFLIAMFTFYTGAIMLALVYGSSDAYLLENIGSGASQFLYNDPRGILTIFGWTFAVLAGVTILEIWGIMKAKKFAFLLGILVSFVIAIVNVITLMAYGVNNFQLTLRLGLGAILPLMAIYYLTRPGMRNYLRK